LTIPSKRGASVVQAWR